MEHKQAETEAAANVEAEEEFKDLDLSGDSQEESEDGESPVEKTKEQFAAEKQAARDAKKAEKDALKAAEKAKKLAEKPVDRSKAVAESWANPDVKAARCSRAGAKVTFVVNGIETKKEYESVNKAFTDLALPLSIHIDFRTKMRKEGRNIIEKDGVTYLFVAVEKSTESAEDRAVAVAAKNAEKQAVKDKKLPKRKQQKAKKSKKNN